MMNYTRTQSSNTFAKAIAVLGASTLLSCSAVVLLFSQSALSGQPTSEAEQLLAQNSGRGSNDGGSDGLDGVNPSDPNTVSAPGFGTMNAPDNTGDVEARQELSPRLSDDPTDPVNRQEGMSVNDDGVGERQEGSPRLEDNLGDRDARRDGSMMNNDGSMMNNGGSMMNNGSAQQRQDLSPNLEDNPNANDDPTRPTPSVTTPRGGASSQQPSYNQNAQPTYNQNTGGSSSAPVRGLW